MARWIMRAMRLTLVASLMIGGQRVALGQVNNACLVYRERGFSGEHLQIGRNGRLAEMSGTWDNSVSSVRVAQGCLLVAFQDKGFRGTSESFGPGDYPVLPSGWDDEFSSMQCNCL